MVLGQQEQSVLQRLREWYLDAETKGGTGEKATRAGSQPVFCALAALGVAVVAKRAEAPGPGHGCDDVGRAVDDSGDQRGVEWVRDPGGLESATREGRRLVASALGRTAQAPGGAVPDEWQVLVLADRGLYARWMWDAIRACGWHPFCGSIWGLKPGRWARKRLSGSVDGCRGRERVGRDEWSVLLANTVGSREPCCCIGKRDTSLHGSC